VGWRILLAISAISSGGLVFNLRPIHADTRRFRPAGQCRYSRL
jgi:hypothetical protein